MAQIPVRDIDLKNKEFLDILNGYSSTVLKRDSSEQVPSILKDVPIMGKMEEPEKWLSDEYMHQIINEGTRHEGYPLMMNAYSSIKHNDGSKHQTWGMELKSLTGKLNKDIIQYISCRNNALNAVYPPKGFISWHNNANAPGYNLILTYSETGEGWFDYWDHAKGERVRIHDKPGWQAKMTFFGPYSEIGKGYVTKHADPDQICYHAAYTDCYRITVAFVFANADNFWEEVIEDLETEY